MICMVSSPVSPLSFASSSSNEGRARETPSIETEVHKEEEEEVVDFDRALMHEPIVGVEPSAKAIPEAHVAKPLPSTPTMTDAEREKHNLTHQPPHRGCPMCVAPGLPT